MTLKGKHALVIGLGESGKAAARFLLARGARVTVTDQKSRSELGPDAEALASLGARLELGGHCEAAFAGQELIVPSPGVPWDLPVLEAARRGGVAVMGELEIASDWLRGPVIGITGTNGKTTTTSLLGHILTSAGWRTQTGGNLGTPVLAMVDPSSDETWNVLELSSFQLEAATRFHVHIAVVLNVTPDHLDRHGTFEAYVAAKQHIFQAQSAGDYAVLNAADPACRRFARQTPAQVCWFSPASPPERNLEESGALVRDGWIHFRGERVMKADLPMRGAHNVDNALAAVAAARLAGVAAGPIAGAVRTFRPVEHRLEFVRQFEGVDYYNDSKATNVDAAIKAVEAFDGGLWVILGGRDKGGVYDALAPLLKERARAALLIGEASALIERHLRGAVECVRLDTLERAVEYARGAAAPGDTVLLAPACASFDQFENYMRRGERFKQLAEALR